MDITDLYMVILSSYIISSLTYASSQWPSYNKYQNISFSKEQLDESIVRLILFYSEIKIQDLINQIDLSKDTSLFSEVEELKKKIEFYQNTL